MEIAGNAFLVTGGSSGLGAACVRRLAAAGGLPVIADVNVEAGTALARELGDAVRFVRTDVTDPDGVSAALDVVEARGTLRGAINCAGIAIGMRVVGREGPHDLEAFLRVININLVGTFNVLRLAAARMTESEPNDEGERGVIINTASVAGYEGQIGQIAYAASKGGVLAMTLPAARDLASRGIRVMTIAPGIFATPMVTGMPEKIQESLAASIPFPSRLGHPDEYARLAQQILENPMLNGEVIRLDGAVRLAPR
jgi:NAD(P)-dependent dehydrogenase (short-subunit alcohol dehydrogenase family)